MKKNILLPLSVLIALGSSAMAEPYYDTNTPAAYHQVPEQVSHFYIGGAYGMTTVDDDYFYQDRYGSYYENTEIDFNALMLQAGYEYNPYLAMEFRYWFSMNDGDYSLSSGYVPPAGSYNDFDAWGFYLKPQYPVTPEFSIYGLFGFSGVYVEGEPAHGWDLLDDSSFSWGLGAAFNVTPNISLFIDYVMLYDDTFNSYYDYYGYYDYYDPENTRVQTVNFGVTYKF